jgi:hypothetical protein
MRWWWTGGGGGGGGGGGAGVNAAAASGRGGGKPACGGREVVRREGRGAGAMVKWKLGRGGRAGWCGEEDCWSQTQGAPKGLRLSLNTWRVPAFVYNSKKKTQTNIVLTVTINGSRVIYYNERIKAYSFNAREKRNGRVECFCSCAECFSYSVECFSDSAECFCSSVCSCRVESSRDEASRLCGAVGRTDGRMNGGDVLGGASFCC